jgi:hypothetical protein
MIASSLKNTILVSRCAFSITLEPSATLIELALSVPAVIIYLYSWSTVSVISGVEPEVTFKVLVIRCSLSPELMRSGE